MKYEDTGQQFSSQVRKVRLVEIRPSMHNPRGPVDEKDGSFERLATSIQQVGLLVPIVVRALSSSKDGCKFELVDGERRYWAARRIGLVSVPAHVLETAVESADLRRLMFHLHMTREQWGPLAQCSSLDEIYPEIKNGMPWEDKASWTKRLARDMGMHKVTARDRVRILCWPLALKTKIYEFNEDQPSKDIYSYVLALEASVVEPSVEAFPTFYNHNSPKDQKINKVREILLAKSLDALTFGSLITREQIRDVKPLFAELPPSAKTTGLKIFEKLVRNSDYIFQDVVSDLEIRLPEALIKKIPKPRSVIAAMRSLARTLESYDPEQYLGSDLLNPKTKRLRRDFHAAVDSLSAACESLNVKLR